MKDEKHLAFLSDCPEIGSYMMFPGYYEDLKEDIDAKYVETTKENLEFAIGWHASLANSNYKVFKIKSNDQDRKRNRTKE